MIKSTFQTTLSSISTSFESYSVNCKCKQHRTKTAKMKWWKPVSLYKVVIARNDSFELVKWQKISLQGIPATFSLATTNMFYRLIAYLQLLKSTSGFTAQFSRMRHVGVICLQNDKRILWKLIFTVHQSKRNILFFKLYTNLLAFYS